MYVRTLLDDCFLQMVQLLPVQIRIKTLALCVQLIALCQFHQTHSKPFPAVNPSFAPAHCDSVTIAFGWLVVCYPLFINSNRPPRILFCFCCVLAAIRRYKFGPEVNSCGPVHRAFFLSSALFKWSFTLESILSMEITKNIYWKNSGFQMISRSYTYSCSERIVSCLKYQKLL